MIIFHKQEKDYTCGPACMRMILSSKGINSTETELALLMETIPELSLKGGTKCAAFAKVAKQFNLKFQEKTDSNIETLKELLEKKIIIVVLFMQRSKDGDCGHFAIVKKITKDKIYFLDPDENDKTEMKIQDFITNWFSESEVKPKWFFAVE
jgi:ABC-type bacteriocin/lantibiotic exporter with double-glycine peptidase domain